ncbi:MAG: MFS transporter [Rhodocyclales bacterium]|nr:MFS transporter [Rhodocyclales bacterium]
MSAAPAARIVALLCLAETLSMTGFAAYPAFLPTLRAQWGMSGAEAGFVGGAFFCGYMLAVPLLSGVTDRIDARGVFAFSCLLAAAGTAGFGLLAQGVASAAAFQALTGAGLAGTYMPGLKALTDRVTGERQPRHIAFYTATFGIGTSLSLLAAGWLGAVLPWQTAFLLLAGGPLLAAPTVLLGLRAQAPHAAQRAPWLPRFGPVLAQRETRRFILGYAVHCWELFGLRSWMVAFIVFAYATARNDTPTLTATEAAALINLLGLPASILGNEAAGRCGRKRWIAGVMTGSGILCWIAGYSAAWPWWLMLATLALYFIAVMADSAALTAGLVQAAPLAQRGAAMAVYSLLGFGAGFVAPLVFGATLDAAGGAAAAGAWTLAFGTLGLGCLAWRLLARADKV